MRKKFTQTEKQVFGFSNPSNIAAECPTPDGAVIVLIDGYVSCVPVHPVSKLMASLEYPRLIRNMEREYGKDIHRDLGQALGCELVEMVLAISGGGQPERFAVRQNYAAILARAISRVEKTPYVVVSHYRDEQATAIDKIRGTTEGDLQAWMDKTIKWSLIA